MGVDGGDALVGTRLKQLGGHNLLDCQHDAILAPDTDGRAAILDSLKGVVDLEVLAIRGEDGVIEIVAGTY